MNKKSAAGAGKAIGSKIKAGARVFAKQGMLLLYGLERRIFPVDKSLVFFESNVGRNYTGNPRAIYEEMVRQGLDKTYCCCYSFEHPAVSLPGRVRKIKRLSILYFYILARAGFWVSDSRLPAYVIKRKDTVYIQTWHGTPLKKLALDMEKVFMSGESDIEAYKQGFYENALTWDYLISQNAFSTRIFRRAFGFQKKMLEIGYPRNDVLFQKNNKADQEKIRSELGIPKGKKVILYAPTWRDNEYDPKGNYKFNPVMDFKKMQKELSDQYVMLVKYHYLVEDMVDWEPYRGFIYEFDKRFDISMLYLAADCLITDYSSVMFDFSILGRPMFFFVYDLENYKDNLRGFYFDLSKESPGPLSTTTEELISQIKNYRQEAYAGAYKAFREKYNHADDGRASQTIVDLMKQLRREAE